MWKSCLLNRKSSLNQTTLLGTMKPSQHRKFIWSWMFLFFIDHSPSRRIMRRIWLWSSALKQNLNYTCSVETTYVRHCLEIHSNYINIKYDYWSNEAVYYSLRLWWFIKYPLCSFWKLKQYLIVIMAYTAVNEITCLFKKYLWFGTRDVCPRNPLLASSYGRPVQYSIFPASHRQFSCENFFTDMYSRLLFTLTVLPKNVA